MKTKTPVVYTKNDRVEYIYACLKPYGVKRDIIRKVLDKDEEFAAEVVRGGDIFKYGNICKIKLAYIPPKPSMEKYNMKTGKKDILPETAEYNRLSFKPMVVFNNELKEQTSGDAYYFPSNKEEINSGS